MYNEPNGYCIFNNAAIATRHALEVLDVERVLLVDWDAHHGQGLQYAFYDDPRYAILNTAAASMQIMTHVEVTIENCFP